MSATFAINFMLSTVNADVHWGHLSEPGMFTFGDFESQNVSTYAVYEVRLLRVVVCCKGQVVFSCSGS